MAKPENPLQMAVIGAAHGIRGELRVKTFTADPLALADYGPLYARDGRAFEISGIRPAGSVVIVRFKGVADRSAAEALTGTELFVDRSRLPDEEEDEFYHTDLVGLAVKDGAGAVLGKVVAVQNFGGGDILDLTLGAARGVLIPFSKAAVPEVSVAGGFVRIDPRAAGLLGDEEAEEEEEGPGSGVGARKDRPRGPRDGGGNR